MTKPHNNIVPNVHLHKHWHDGTWAKRGFVRCHFDQAAQKKKRHLRRQAKAKAIAPRPAAGPLRPVVRCETFKYNTRTRLGRGFTVAELKVRGKRQQRVGGKRTPRPRDAFF